jgi:hypothetical protein
MPRREDLYLADILTACRHVATFLEGKSLEDWIDDELLQFGVLQRLTVIGEAARRLDPAVRNQYPEGAVAGSHRLLVESAWGAVPGLLPVRFPGPLAEPAVPVSRQRALHGVCR